MTHACFLSILIVSLVCAEMPRLQVSPNKRFLMTEKGEPFFYLADTAWELFHRLNREDAERYLKDRAKKGFTVIQAVVLAEVDGLHSPNAYGHTPLAGDDPSQPNEAYFAHVDWIVNKAAEEGLFIGMLPTWGDKWNKAWGKGPEIFTRVPDDSLIVPAEVSTAMPGAGIRRFVATRDSNGSYAMVYAPAGRPFSVRMDKVNGPKVRAWWFNPRNGLATPIGEFPNRGTREFCTPDRGEEIDWVLVLDDASQNYPPPGQKGR